MVKRLTTAFSLVLSIASINPALAQKKGSSSGTASVKPALKFLDAIEVSSIDMTPKRSGQVAISQPESQELPDSAMQEQAVSGNNQVEMASAIQLKYAVLLNTDVEQVQNTALFAVLDEWYGTRYILGGSTKDGIDCSAFTQLLYTKLFQIAIPRTAKEQYNAARAVSRTELKQGDLVFFHTRGSGVSHVGIYLQNNKFAHAATSGGVMISDLYETYWAKHFVGAGRYDAAPETEMATLKP